MFAKACRSGLRQDGVCTYTTGCVPTSETKELRQVLEVARAGVVDHTDCGIAIAIQLGDAALSATLRGVARFRRRALRRALGLLLGLGVALGWRTAHFELCDMLVMIGETREDTM